MPIVPQVFTWPVRVYVEDTDFGGIVFYANYLKYFERARTEFLRSLGISQQLVVDEHRVAFVVTHISVDYRAPARMDEELIVTAFPEKTGRASMMFLQEIRRGENVLVKAEVSVACVSIKSLRPRPIPEVIRNQLLSLHQGRQQSDADIGTFI